MRILPKSIRGRMLALSTLATLGALVVAAFVMVHVLERIVTQGIDRRLDAQIALLATSVDADGRLDRPRLAALDQALFAGPGWEWRIETPSEIVSSHAFPILDGPPRRPGRARPAPPGPQPMEGRGGDGKRVHARETILETVAGPVRISASAPRSVIERPVGEAMLPLLLVLAALSVLLGGAALLQLRYGLRPIDRLREAVAAVRSGRETSVPAEQPAELQPLAEELNDLLRDNEAALGGARASAANLAHALKTSVATLALELRGQPDALRQVERIDATIRHHLARARDRVLSTRWQTSVEPAVNGLAATVRRLHADREAVLDIAVPPDLAVAVDPADLDEILGNLIDNAMRHARSLVSVRAEGHSRTIGIEVTDDGPGIAEALRIKVMAPGVRLDERSEGSGFGLAIVRELVELYGGKVVLGTAKGGGLIVSLALPRARD